MPSKEPIPAPAPPPARLLPALPLPAYRYVPGLQPHPTKGVGGHRHLDGHHWPTPHWSPDADWQQSTPWLHGLDLFNHRFYWESHECWEMIWHAIPSPHVDRQLVQALIQAAAFVIKRHTGVDRAAATLLQRSTQRLATVRTERGQTHRGVDLVALPRLLEDFNRGGAWPHVPQAGL